MNLQRVELKAIGNVAKVFVILVLSSIIPGLITVGSWLLLVCIDGTCCLSTAVSNIQEDSKILAICVLSGQIGFFAASILLVATFTCRQVLAQAKQFAFPRLGSWLRRIAWVSCTMFSLVLFHSHCFI